MPDPRNSDEAWAVTVPVIFHLGTVGPSRMLPDVHGGDDARHAAWIPADTLDILAGALADLYDGQVFPAHVGMLAERLGTGS